MCCSPSRPTSLEVVVHESWTPPIQLGGEWPCFRRRWRCEKDTIAVVLANNQPWWGLKMVSEIGQTDVTKRRQTKSVR